MGKNICGYFGNGCVGSGMSIESIVSHGLYAAMVLEKLKLVKNMR